MTTSKIDQLIEANNLFIDAMENAFAVYRQNIKKIQETGASKSDDKHLPESYFLTFAWRDENGAKLGPYQIALIQDNDEQNWRHAFNILKANHATIGSRFHKQDYEYSYWLYDKMDYKIFRQKLKEAS